MKRRAYYSIEMSWVKFNLIQTIHVYHALIFFSFFVCNIWIAIFFSWCKNIVLSASIRANLLRSFLNILHLYQHDVCVCMCKPFPSILSLLFIMIWNGSLMYPVIFSSLPNSKLNIIYSYFEMLNLLIWLNWYSISIHR